MHRFTNAYRKEFAVRVMCRLLRWLHAPESAHQQEESRLLELIRHSCIASHGVHGARRVFAASREAGERCGKHSVWLASSRPYGAPAQPSAAAVH